MKKVMKIMAIILTGIMLVLLTGCGNSSDNGFHSSRSYTYNVETGDSVKIELDTSDGYKLDSDLPFTISKGDEELMTGKFLTKSDYNECISEAESRSDTTLIDSGTKKGLEYSFYNVGDFEYDYIIKIKGSKTGILLSGKKSEKSAKECFKRLNITLDD